MYTGFGCLDWVSLIENRRSRTREMIDLINLNIKRERNVMPHQLEVRLPEQVADVMPCTRVKVIDR
jgi:hypothetical protein